MTDDYEIDEVFADGTIDVIIPGASAEVVRYVPASFLDNARREERQAICRRLELMAEKEAEDSSSWKHEQIALRRAVGIIHARGET